MIRILEPNNVNTEPQEEPPESTKKYDELEVEISSISIEIDDLNTKIQNGEQELEKLLKLDILGKESSVNLNYTTLCIEKIDTRLVDLTNAVESLKAKQGELEHEFEEIQKIVTNYGWRKFNTFLFTGWSKINKEE